MSAFPNSQQLLGGIASRNPQMAAVRQIISPQCDPEISVAIAKAIIAIAYEGAGR